MELQLRSSGIGALDASELPEKPLFSVAAPTSSAPPCPTPRDPPSVLGSSWAPPGSSAVGRLAAPRAPPSRSACRAPPLAAQRSAEPAPPAAALQTPPPPQGAPGPRREPEPGHTGGSGRGSSTRTRRRCEARRRRAGRGKALRAGHTQLVLPRRVALAPEEASSGREPGGAGAAVELETVPALERTAAAPLAGLPESGWGGGSSVARGSGAPRPRVPEPGAAGPRGRAPPAPSGLGPPPSSAAPRGSGAVPAQSPRRAAPRPTPASARLRVTSCPAIGPRGPGGGAEAGELTAAPRHWPGRRTRAVAGRQRYPEPESFQLRCVELSGSGPGWAVGAGPGGAAWEEEEHRSCSAPARLSGGRALQVLVSVRVAEGRVGGARAAAGGGARGGRGARGRGRGRARAGAWGALLLAAGARVFTCVGGGCEEWVRVYARVWRRGGPESKGRACLRAGGVCFDA